jgi:AmmeMemoRadiSam system protein A
MKDEQPDSLQSYTPPERDFLLGLARGALTSAALGCPLPQVSAEGLEPKLTAARACFVTLTIEGKLRGCIGHVRPRAPLYQAVMDCAQGAAQRDPRFPPVGPGEVPLVRIEISVLTEPRELSFTSPEELLGQLEPLHHGVVLRAGGRTVTFLPQVWEQIPERTHFLERLSEKAGCNVSLWREPGTTISVYCVESFDESEQAGARN